MSTMELEKDAKPPVFLTNCREYDSRQIERILTDGITHLGVKLPRQGKVLLKPNVLSAFKPEQNITTHPAVLEAMVKLLLDNENEVIIADSSSIPGGTGRALKRSGIAAIAERYDKVSALAFEGLPTRAYENPANRYLPSVNLACLLDEVDCIINMPKLKSHMLVRLTCAVKNIFGCVPGGGKQQAHVIAPSSEEFSELLIDLYGFLKPRIVLNILDGISGLDGFGPGPTGRRTNTSFMILSADAVALDHACSKVIRVAPDKIPTNRVAVERGLGTNDYEANQELESVRFRLPRPLPAMPFIFRHVSGMNRRRPRLVEKKCEKCGICAKICPVQCITMDEHPRWDYARCIYCYCCHESCPEGAIKLKFSLSLFQA